MQSQPTSSRALKLVLRGARLLAVTFLSAVGLALMGHAAVEGFALLANFGTAQSDVAAMSLAFAVAIYLPMLAAGTLCLGWARHVAHRPFSQEIAPKKD